jgi:hypothetical protein
MKLCGKPLAKVNRYGRLSRSEACGKPAGHKMKCVSVVAYQEAIERARIRSAETFLDGSALANWLRYHGLSVKGQ